MKVIDLFAGSGGFSLGFIKAGFTIKTAVEFDKSIANTYAQNHSNVDVIVDDIANVDINNVFNKGSADVIIGGPPCQGFSMAGARIRNGFIDDERNYLFRHYFNIVKKVKPKVFVMENVKGISTMQNGQIFNEIIQSFESKTLLDGDSYKIFHKVIKASNFGVPQARERMIIIGVLNSNVDIGKLFDDVLGNLQKSDSGFFEKVTVWDAISNLSNINPSVSGEVNNPVPTSDYQTYLSSDKDKLFNHTSTNHSQSSINRMQQINQGENFTSLNEVINSVHSGSYGRLREDAISSTITTRFDTPSGGRFTHPIHNRTLTPREAARIQSFPDEYVFYGSKSSICKQIGNAVPPKCSYFLAKVVKEILKNVK